MAAPTSPGSLHPLTRWLTRRRSFLRLITVAHVAVYRGSGGRIGARGRGLEFLLLHTVGARSGRARTTPLLYLADGDALVVVASNGGRDSHPGWHHNLLRVPAAAVTVGREGREVRARVAAPHERERLWPLLDRLYPYDAYRAHTGREIPIVLLERA